MTGQQLKNEDIAILCDIGGSAAADVQIRSTRIGELIATGFLVRDPAVPGHHLKLTARAQEALASLGVGINEA